jgi:hypothetical protein
MKTKPKKKAEKNDKLNNNPTNISSKKEHSKKRNPEREN